MAKRLLRIMFGLVVAVGLALTGALIFATSDMGSKWISQKLRQTLRSQTGLDVQFSDIDLAIVPPRLLLRDLTAKGVSLDVGCSVEEAEISLSVLALISGQVEVEEVYVGAPRCDVNLTGADLSRLQANRDSQTAREFKLDFSVMPPFDVVALSNGVFHVNIDDPGRMGKVRAAISGFYLDVTGRTATRDKVEVRSLLERAHVVVKRGKFNFDERVSGLAFRAAVTEQAVNLRYIKGTVAGVRLSARALFVPFELAGKTIWANYAKVDVPLEHLNRWPLALPPMSGQAGFTGQVGVNFGTGQFPEVSARGRVRLHDGVVDEFVLGNLGGVVSVGVDGVAWSNLVIEVATGRIDTTGSLAFDERLHVDAKAKLTGVELGQLLENLTVTDAQVMQKMTGDVSVKGAIKGLSLKGRTRMQVTGHRVFDRSFRDPRKETLLSLSKVDVKGPFKIDEEGLTANGLTVTKGNSLVIVDLFFGFALARGWHLSAHSPKMDLSDVAEVAGFGLGGVGQLDCKLVAKGYGAPIIDAKGQFKRIKVAGVEGSEMRTQVRFDGRRLMFKELWARIGKSVYETREVNLDFGAKGGLALSAKVDVNNGDLHGLARAFKVDTRRFGTPGGVVNGTVDVQYRSRDDYFRVEMLLSHSGLTLFNEVFGPGRMDAVYDDGLITVERLDMSKGKGTLVASGTVSDKGDLNMMVVASDVRMEDIVYPAISDLELEGRGQVFAMIEGRVDHPMANVRLRLSDTVRRGIRYGDSELEVSLNGDLVRATGTLLGRKLLLKQFIADMGVGRFAVEATLEQVPLLGFMAPAQTQQGEVVVSGDVALEGNLSGKLELTGQAVWREVFARFNQFEIHNKRHVVMTVNQDTFRLEKSRFLSRDMVFDVAGEAGAREFRLSVNGLANLSGLTRFTDVVQSSSGRLSFNAVINGPYDRPRLRGGAAVTDGAFTVAGFPRVIKEVSGRVEMGSGRIRFVDFQGRSAGGAIDMNGYVNLNGMNIDDYRFNLFLANLEIDLMDGLTIRTSTLKNGLVLHPGKKRNLPFVEGDVEISRFKYTEPIHVIRISDLNIGGLSKTTRKVHRPRLFDKSKDLFEYDIALHGDKNLAVINNLLDARFRIDDRQEPLRLVGTNQGFGFLGRVLANEGNVYFAGKTFELRSSMISFKDALRPDNPNFRVTADVDVRDWKITITAEGTVEEYKVKLSASPYLSQEDIVFLLLTGMTKQERVQLGGGATVPIAPLMGDLSAGVIPVEVKVYKEYSEKAGTDTTRVALGKRITKDVWMEVSSGVGTEQDVEGTLTYRLNDNFSLSASYDNKDETSKAGNWGLDLRFRLEF